MFPRVPPGEPGPAPWDVRPHSAFAAQVPGPRGPRGPVRRALRGSELLVRAAGSRLRSPGHAARGRPGRIFRGRSWGEGGIPCPPPPSLPSPPPSLGGPTPLWLCLPRAAAGRNSAPPQAAPGGPGIPSVTHGTPLASPGSWGPACVRTAGSSCIPPFRATGPPPASPSWTGCSLRPPGRGSSRCYSRRKDSPLRGVCSPSLRGTPRPTVPRPAGSSLFPRCVSHPLRCIWVISLDSTTGSCCRARLPDVERAA